MITRIWHGRTKAEHADEYLEFLEETGVPDYKSVPGNLSVEIWRRIEGDACHFWTVTKWRNTTPRTRSTCSNSNLTSFTARHSITNGRT